MPSTPTKREVYLPRYFKKSIRIKYKHKSSQQLTFSRFRRNNIQRQLTGVMNGYERRSFLPNGEEHLTFALLGSDENAWNVFAARMSRGRKYYGIALFFR